MLRSVKVFYEAVPRNADSSFGVFQFSGRSFQAPYHRHPEIEITLIAQGRGDLIVGDHFGRFQAGDVIIQGPDLPHSYRSDPGGRAASCYAQFREDVFGAGFWDLSECRPIRSLLRRAQRGLRFSRKNADRLAAKLQTLADRRGMNRLIGLLETLEEAAHDSGARPLASPGYAPTRPARTTEVIEKVLRSIERGWNQPLRLAELAGAVNMHPQSLSRFFQRHFRRGFRDVLLERRLAECARLLLETEEGIAQIAYSCGFNNLSNFNRLFRRAYGASPSDYRRTASGD
jgi:AraC-like DNA-binding protein/quercetin dioxygenase-like cupin family protein